MIETVQIGLNLDELESTNILIEISPERIWIAMLSSVLIGFGDACFNTQIYSLLMR